MSNQIVHFSYNVIHSDNSHRFYASVPCYYEALASFPELVKVEVGLNLLPTRLYHDKGMAMRQDHMHAYWIKMLNEMFSVCGIGFAYQEHEKATHAQWGFIVEKKNLTKSQLKLVLFLARLPQLLPAYSQWSVFCEKHDLQGEDRYKLLLFIGQFAHLMAYKWDHVCDLTHASFHKYGHMPFTYRTLKSLWKLLGEHNNFNVDDSLATASSKTPITLALWRDGIRTYLTDKAEPTVAELVSNYFEEFKTNFCA
jgi:hypothetical protein